MLNFIIGMYVEKKQSICRVWYDMRFQAPAAVLGMCPLWVRSDGCTLNLMTLRGLVLFTPGFSPEQPPSLPSYHCTEGENSQDGSLACLLSISPS